MIRTFLAAASLLALAACNQPAPAGAPGAPGAQQQVIAPPAPTRAPAHPSQSAATASGPTNQVQISPQNQAEVEGNIRDLLGQYQNQFAAGGQPIPGVADVITAIQPGTDHQLPVSLAAGNQYAFVGACDADCNNIDLELLDGTTGAVVQSDLATDDYPVVIFAPTANGNYFVRAILRTCTQAPCYIGIRGVQRGGAGGKLGQ